MNTESARIRKENCVFELLNCPVLHILSTKIALHGIR